MHLRLSPKSNKDLLILAGLGARPPQAGAKLKSST